MKKDSDYTPSSGNIFADLGFEQPEEWQAKAHIAAHILEIIEKRKLTQAAAAKLLDTTQPEVSNLKKGQLDRFTLDRLFRFLTALDQRIEINIRPKSKRHQAVQVTT